ncbi:hypothetical protein V3C99_009615 [Haemonchus contortus]
MECLIFVFVVVGAIAVRPVPRPKEVGTGHERVGFRIDTGRHYKNRIIEDEKAIKKYSSLLGTIEELEAVNILDNVHYVVFLSDANCSKVLNWVKDVVSTKKCDMVAYGRCSPMSGTERDPTQAFMSEDGMFWIKNEL